MATDRSPNDDLELEMTDLESAEADDDGLTSTEEARDEPLGERLRREVPDVPLGHVAVDPDQRAETGFAGRLVRDDGVEQAGGDTGGFSAEEAAVHLRRARATRPRAATRADRLDLLEAEVAVLLAMARIHTEALAELTEALQRTPDEEPGDAAVKVSRGARRAHALLLALRDVPR